MNMDNIQNINTAERVIRLAFSITLVCIPQIIDAPLGDIALLPILAIYPGLTAALGWDPLLALVTSLRHASVDKPGFAGHTW